MTMMRNIRDRLENLVANLGTNRDKASSTTYQARILTDADLLTAYKNAWLPRKIVDVPAFDATRRWRTWQGNSDQINAIEAEEKRLGVRKKVLEARIKARLFGGAGIYFDVGDRDVSEPLDPARIGRGGIRYAVVLSHQDLTATELETDPLSPRFGHPRAYRVQSRGQGDLVIHPSRLITFTGNEDPLPLQSGGTASGWGDSVLQAVYDQLLQTDGTAANIASLVFEAKVDIIKIPNFMQGMLDDEYRSQVMDRVRLASMAKGINGTLMLDAEEEYDQKQVNFASLPDVVQTFLQMASGAADIPVTRLLGQSPAGMSATGESDLKNYYDRVSAEQELFIAPAMDGFDESLIRSATGSRPDEITYDWASLWQLDDDTKSQIGKRAAESIQIIAGTGLIPEEPLSRAAVTALSETGTFPGLDGLVDEYFAENPPDEEETDPELEPESPTAAPGAETEDD